MLFLQRYHSGHVSIGASRGSSDTWTVLLLGFQDYGHLMADRKFSMPCTPSLSFPWQLLQVFLSKNLVNWQGLVPLFVPSSLPIVWLINSQHLPMTFVCSVVGKIVDTYETVAEGEVFRCQVITCTEERRAWSTVAESKLRHLVSGRDTDTFYNLQPISMGFNLAEINDQMICRVFDFYTILHRCTCFSIGYQIWSTFQVGCLYDSKRLEEWSLLCQTGPWTPTVSAQGPWDLTKWLRKEI